VLVVTTRLLAPFAPFVTDWIHRELTGSSVHLADYTRGDGAAGGGRAGGPRSPEDPNLERAMADVRQLAALGRAAREQVGINVRQPLSTVLAVVPGGAGGGTLPDELTTLLKAELNVKEVRWLASSEELVTLEARPNFRGRSPPRRSARSRPRRCGAWIAANPSGSRWMARSTSSSPRR
jgi:isoleucyl-tRNA synthetase